MSRWSSAAARLNRAADGFFAELITILRPPAGSVYVAAGGDPVAVLQLQGVISEGEADGAADGETPGGRTFHQNLAGGPIEASFERTGFASREQWPRKGDLLRVETGERAGDVFEALDGARDDGGRVNVAILRRT
ncbi:MAG: hypothetical protein Q8L59_11115 [Phenylobacterium sp.]|nr:hypothetical protein [Phenylobacterium sp.]